MSTDLITLETHGELAISRPPEQILAEAKKAADALKDVVSKKVKPVKFNGEQYLEFEDWQTIGRFYGITAKVVRTQGLTMGNVSGFEAEAVALHVASGQEISRAESMCMNDEPNWMRKPLFQLRSMAQTRACAKALRNVLAWVVVLAGYRPTPAEELPTDQDGGTSEAPMLLPNFGRHKGQPMDNPDIPIGELKYYLQCAEKSINDQAKAQYKANNERLRDALKAEIEKREKADPPADFLPPDDILDRLSLAETMTELTTTQNEYLKNKERYNLKSQGEIEALFEQRKTELAPKKK